MQFYVMSEPKHDNWTFKTAVLHMAPLNQGEARKCSECGRYVSMLPWLPPYRAEIWAEIKKLGDVAMGVGDSIAVSDRFRLAWEEAQLKGIAAFTPFERLRVRPARLGRGSTPVYFHVAPQLHGTRVDVDRSLIDYGGPIKCNTCLGSPETVRGFSIDESSWTGEDIFYAWGMPGSIIVTDRVRKLRDDYGLTNVNLTRTEEYLWDPLKDWTPWVWYLPE